MKKIIIPILFILLATSVCASIELKDVSADGESCIFDVNGKTVVVDRRDKIITDEYMIYVQEVYPVNTKAQNTDRCKFMYSGIEEEQEVKQMTVGQKVVQFLLGKRDEAEVQDTETTEGTMQKEPPEETAVRVNGYDVTQKEEPAPQAVQQEEQLTFFQKLKRFLFG